MDIRLPGKSGIEATREIVEKGLKIAGDICVYTNQNRVIEELDSDN